MYKLKENQKNLERFLNFYLDIHVKYRQLAVMTRKIIEILRKSQNLVFPKEFYKK